MTNVLDAINYLQLFVVMTVFRLFRKSQMYNNPAVMAGITMPCLKIMHTLICPKDVKKVTSRSEFHHSDHPSKPFLPLPLDCFISMTFVFSHLIFF